MAPEAQPGKALGQESRAPIDPPKSAEFIINIGEASAPTIGRLVFPTQLIQRIDTNISQDLICITADRARIHLNETLRRMECRKSWIAPAGILATILVIFPTTTFQDFLNLPKEYWKAFFSIAAIAAGIWLIVGLRRITRSVTVEEVVSLLRSNSVAPVKTATHSQVR